MQGTGSLGLVHWDDPEGWYGEGGGRGIQDGEHVYIHGRCMLMYGKPIQYCKEKKNVSYCKKNKINKIKYFMHLQEIRFVYFISYHCLPTYWVEYHQRTPPYPDIKPLLLAVFWERKISLIFCHILSRSIMFSYLFTYCQRSYFVIKHLFKFI